MCVCVCVLYILLDLQVVTTNRAGSWLLHVHAFVCHCLVIKDFYRQSTGYEMGRGDYEVHQR